MQNGTRINVTASPPDVRRWLRPPTSCKYRLGSAPGSRSAPFQSKRRGATFQTIKPRCDLANPAREEGKARTRGAALTEGEGEPAGRSHRLTSGGEAGARKVSFIQRECILLLVAL